MNSTDSVKASNIAEPSYPSLYMLFINRLRLLNARCFIHFFNLINDNMSNNMVNKEKPVSEVYRFSTIPQTVHILASIVMFSRCEGVEYWLCNEVVSMSGFVTVLVAEILTGNEVVDTLWVLVVLYVVRNIGGVVVRDGVVGMDVDSFGICVV